MAAARNLSPKESATLAVGISARAQRLLAAGELDGYRELFDELESIADPHRRYQAGVGLIERGFAASGDAPRARVGGLFSAIAAGAVELLDRQPSEPKLLNYAGVAFYELWSLDAARALFKAAKRLDPRSEQVDGNLAALAGRRRTLRSAGRAAPEHPALVELASRGARYRGARTTSHRHAPEPVHDRARRAGDAAALPGLRGRRGR